MAEDRSYIFIFIRPGAITRGNGTVLKGIKNIVVKRELIAALARRHKDLKVKDVDMMARLVFDIMAGALVDGDEIELRGFGAFRLREYAPRQARNPGTGETVDLGPRQGVLFRPGREIRKRLNGK
jgi:integration host factor subunit beta